ncbi:hypothetical protein [Psychrobacter alimentarius]|uniref:hypothetical protein n=1 Tax=Psychrobacter alimentarius TaxID=261164 RepID=UPI00191B04F0|nr:hypothetical protein [Psychrobacter alimentarius]
MPDKTFCYPFIAYPSLKTEVTTKNTSDKRRFIYKQKQFCNSLYTLKNEGFMKFYLWQNNNPPQESTNLISTSAANLYKKDTVLEIKNMRAFIKKALAYIKPMLLKDSACTTGF